LRFSSALRSRSAAASFFLASRSCRACKDNSRL
jgi:hypothetical protein